MDVEQVTALFQDHRDELGFVNRAQVREKDTYVEYRDGEVAGAAICNHCVQKPQTTLYDIAVAEEYRREGVATLLIEKMATESPHDSLVAKCPCELPANHFYRTDGWEKVAVEEGKSRSLNVWEKDI